MIKLLDSKDDDDRRNDDYHRPRQIPDDGDCVHNYELRIMNYELKTFHYFAISPFNKHVLPLPSPLL